MPGACVPSGLPVALQAPELFDLDDGRVPKEMRELMEGGGQPTVEELLEKWDEGREEEEEEQEEEQGAQGEQPPAVDEAGPSAAPAPEEVGPSGALDDPGRGGPREAGGARQQECPGEGARRVGDAPPGDR